MINAADLITVRTIINNKLTYIIIYSLTWVYVILMIPLFITIDFGDHGDG